MAQSALRHSLTRAHFHTGVLSDAGNSIILFTDTFKTHNGIIYIRVIGELVIVASCFQKIRARPKSTSVQASCHT